MCINQYPNILIVTMPGAAVKTGKGTFTVTTPAEPLTLACRYEADKTVRDFTTADGNVVKTKGIVYLPAKTPIIAVGSVIEVPGYVKAPVLQFYKGELHCTLTV